MSTLKKLRARAAVLEISGCERMITPRLLRVIKEEEDRLKRCKKEEKQEAKERVEFLGADKVFPLVQRLRRCPSAEDVSELCINERCDVCGVLGEQLVFDQEDTLICLKCVEQECGCPSCFLRIKEESLKFEE